MGVRNKNKDILDYKSVVYHRKLWKIFNKVIPNVHMLFFVIFEFLGCDRMTNITIEGTAELKDISDDCFNKIAYNDDYISRDNNKVYENQIGYDVDETILKMKNKQNVKHFMNVPLDLNKSNYASKLQRHSPFKNKHLATDSVWVPSQNPMNYV